MLWASGVGAEVIRPMAAPVLGGLLLADEVVDLLLPVLFYWSRLRRLPNENTVSLAETNDVPESAGIDPVTPVNIKSEISE
jgi:Cu(I)/Ag(I) efflux system membrane protein CusA/SilA